MSLLQQDPSAPDDAARGESFTKGTSHVVWASIAAAILVSIAVAIYVITGEKPPAATAEITQVTAHFRHQVNAGRDANGEPIPEPPFDQLLLFAHVRLHNQSKNPLFMLRMMANLPLAGEIRSSYAASAHDYQRLFDAYPELAGFRGKPLPMDATIAPGDWIEGDVVCSFQMTQDQWNARKGLDYSLSFRYQPDLKVSPTGTVEVK